MREDSHEVCSVVRMPELKCLCGFCDREASEPKSKVCGIRADRPMQRSANSAVTFKSDCTDPALAPCNGPPCGKLAVATT